MRIMGVFEVMYFEKIKFCLILLVLILLNQTKADDDDYNVLHTNGAFEFGYNNPDSYHYAQGNRNNVVKGEFGGRNPKTGGIDSTIYTAGPRGFRPRGKNIVRKYDLNQSGPRPIGSKDDPYYDPHEDPSYNFSFRTRTYNRDEKANRVGDVSGKYSYVDDIGERHNVEYIAGKNTGFHVKTPFPDSNPRAYGPLYFRGRGRPIPRGRTSIQRGLDGSYKFVSAGPDQRRTETSDSTGHVRGSYTYLDDKGVQHSVHYIAGPETGYRVLKTVKGPHLPTVFPFNHPDIIPADFYDYNDKDVFDTAATGHARPSGRPGARPSTRPGASPFKPDDITGDTAGDDDIIGEDDFGKVPKPGESRPTSGTSVNFGNKQPDNKKPFEPAFGDDDSGYDTDFGDLFDDGGKQGKQGFGKGGNKEEESGEGVSGKGGSGKGGSGNDGYKHGNVGSKDGANGSSKPSNQYIPPKETTSEDQSGEEYGNTGNRFGKPSSGNRKKPSSTRPSTGKSKPAGRPEVSASEENDDFGLFGSETGRPKPTYGNKDSDDGPLITIGGSTKDCPRCQGTVLTNVGDTYLSVPPGVSVRAHVQAVDLLPYSSRFPGPSDQYKADLMLKTEQLNSGKDTIIGEIEDSTDDATKEETTTEIDATTIWPSSSTKT